MVGVGPWIASIWEMLGLSDRIDVRTPAGEVHRDQHMWTYWYLQEGEISVDPKLLSLPDGSMPPVLHVDSDAPLYDDDGHLRPDKLLKSLRTLMESRGAEFLANREMTGFRFEGKNAKAIVTDRGEVEADEFVIAAGSLTPFLSKHLGCQIPIQPGKGYSLTMPRPAICPAIPLIFPETRVAVTPFRSGYRLGSTMEFGVVVRKP